MGRLEPSRRRPSAWFYSFTHCPAICPTALAVMAQASLKELGSFPTGDGQAFQSIHYAILAAQNRNISRKGPRIPRG
ncbi:SCO family protein [Ensifer sp. ENS02]|nr:SCO family protein [Ensifer sp. ENS02]